MVWKMMQERPEDKLSHFTILPQINSGVNELGGLYNMLTKPGVEKKMKIYW